MFGDCLPTYLVLLPKAALRRDAVTPSCSVRGQPEGKPVRLSAVAAGEGVPCYSLWKRFGPEGVPAYMIEKGRASRTLISIFGIFCWIMFFRFFREQGKGEVGGEARRVSGV